MPQATINITFDYTAEQLANCKEFWPNANGTAPTNAELVANIKADLTKYLKQKYRGKLHDKQTAAMAAITDLTLS